MHAAADVQLRMLATVQKYSPGPTESLRCCPGRAKGCCWCGKGPGRAGVLWGVYGRHHRS